MKIAVTGASGYIGSHLCAALREYGCDLFEIELQPYKPMVVDVLFHLAAPSHVGLFDEAPAYAFRQLADANGWLHHIKADRCVFTSTACEKGLYAISKRMTEDLVKELFPSKYSIVRLHNVAGGKWPEGRTPTHLIPTLTTGKITINGSGQQVRDYIHIQDVVDALFMVAGLEVDRRIAKGTPFNSMIEVGSGVGHTVWQVVARYLQLTGKSVEISCVEQGRATNPDRQVCYDPFFTDMKTLDQIIMTAC